MVLHRTLHPSTPDARYHARRRARLVTALGSSCAECGFTPTLSHPAGALEIDHTQGGGTLLRAGGHTSREIGRLLALSPTQLHEQVRLLCGPCHAAAPTTQRFTKAGV